MAIHVHPLLMVWAVVVWVATYLLANWLVAMTQRKTLVCWTVGIFGLTAVYLRPPSQVFRGAAVAIPAMLTSAAFYASLYLPRPQPLSGLDDQSTARLAVFAGAFAVIAGLELARLIGDLRFPLWGEARVLALVQRSRALGGLIHFTPAGRRFLRERFGATPSEFVRTLA